MYKPPSLDVFLPDATPSVVSKRDSSCLTVCSKSEVRSQTNFTVYRRLILEISLARTVDCIARTPGISKKVRQMKEISDL